MSKNRSSHQRIYMKEGVLRNFTKFSGKHLCQCLFFNKQYIGTGLNFIKKETLHWCFLVNFAKFQRTPFSQNIIGRLLLKKAYETEFSDFVIR